MRSKFFLVVIFLCVSVVSLAETQGEAFLFYLENDTRDIGGPGSDNAYSSGFKFSYVWGENRVPGWADHILNRSDFLKEQVKNSSSHFGLSIGQQIYTPNDIRRSDLILDDRPYAGWLYLGMSAQFKNRVRSHAFELDLGLIGPEALGKNFQNEYHHFIRKYDAEGWEHQLNTEPTLQISYQQRLKFFDLHWSEEKYADVIPFFGASVGNVAVDAHVGGMLRIGWGVPEDFGPSRPSSTDGDAFLLPSSTFEKRIGIYGFMAGRGIGVARNIFLDGNTFRDSHRVKKYPFVIETEVGWAAFYQRWNVAWRFVTRSPEFEQRSRVNSFASISVGYTFK